MIFDDFDDEMLCDTYQQTAPEIKDMEFETSLDNDMVEKHKLRENMDHSAFYEVFQIQINERFFLQPSSKPQDHKEVSLKYPSFNSRNALELGASSRPELILREQPQTMTYWQNSFASISQPKNGPTLIVNPEASGLRLEELTSGSESNDCEEKMVEDEKDNRNEMTPSLGKADTLLKPENHIFKEAKSISSFLLKKRNVSALFNSKSRNQTLRKNNRKRINDEVIYKEQESKRALMYSICDFRISAETTSNSLIRRSRSVTNVTREIFKQADNDNKSVESLVSLENIENIKKRRMDVDGESCSVCEKAFGLNAIIARTLACLHVFHKECIKDCVDQQHRLGEEITCPSCNHFL